MAIKLELSQKQVVSQKMIQSLGVLQMSSQELSEYIKEISLENPAVDFEEGETNPQDEERLRKLEWLANLDEQNRSYYQYDRDDAENDTGMNNIASRSAESLGDVLRMQLMTGDYSPKQKDIFEYIIECLDSKGFFNVPVSEMAMVHGCSEEMAQECLDIMRSLEPAGVCAENVQHCLLIQIDRKEDVNPIARAIVSDYLDLLGKNQLHIIARNLGVEISDVLEAVSVIKELNPRPAQGFDNGELMRYVVPDITVVKFEDHFEILLNDYTCPTLHVNKEYLNMLKSDCDKEVKDYLFQKVKQAEDIQDCIQRRSSTLMSLAKCIVDVQREFFMTGQPNMKLFRLQDAAEIIGCHESTVSRALRDKYLQCCWGVYPLSFFFPKSIGDQESGAGKAVLEVKEKLKKVIDGENKEKPYSDDKIAQILNAQGVEISRRTVVKYREEMGIPNSRGRKNFV